MSYIKENYTDNLENELRYLKLLSKQYPTIADACIEIINLQAILNLPKGTEHFLSDIHGEYEPFIHVLKNASGVIKRKIQDIFGNSLMEEEIKSLATLIYYPEQKLELIIKKEKNIEDWYKVTLYRLIEVCRRVSSKYTRSKVRKALPKDFAYIIEELLHEESNNSNKERYYNEIIKTIINIGRSKEFITAICKVIQDLVIDRLHIVGDIFDRGPGADIIMDTLINYHSVDIQWGNHDIVWMGAAAGSEACIATVIRSSARYGNLATIEDGYGISLLPLATFAIDFYGNDECLEFKPIIENDKNYSDKEINIISKMHKAIAIIQFKLEGAVIKRRPYFSMEDRLLLDKINYEKGTINLNGKEYKLKDTNFPTIDPKDPYKLIPEEIELIEKLKSSFLNSEKLQRHVSFLFAKGSLYLKYNSNLLYHGCIPLNDDGTFKKVRIGASGKEYSGKALLDRLEIIVREGYFHKDNPEAKLYGMDMIWYLWNGSCSPLFGKDKMTTFERYFIEDKETHIEKKNHYFDLEDDEKACNMIFEEFGLDPKTSHIINGHVPVKIKKGESPIKANGKLLVIDGGFSKAYQSQTGIAGYTLIYNSYGLSLVSHEPFESTQKAIEEEKDILSTRVILETEVERMRVADTDIGKELKLQIEDLEKLLNAYRTGLIKEQI
ncbi:MAG: fructose-1,6-bisphosphatase [Clostridiales bacterium]|uniref:Fructose-1,6-bisphosphatase class 3 n=1 Tax=Clostridium isatidis TaxID=182773 RepID=A0A343JEL4_9CLOT|nr:MULTISPECIES: fructose-1,6-bisphosphatase [Eubacteriales]ASW43972.1 fructose 1,6-bisphosphatase [Clostridium isatidis]MBU5455595.1 fructose-1,6-bisphosphatase [Caproiciproducens sp. MSJ-32]NLZ47763.1 fructose-1,6-bisphosphatase [Clostridiales bacterium]